LNMSKPLAIRRATSADCGRLLGIQSTAIHKFAADHYDAAVIDAIIDATIGNSGPMLDEMIAREHCFIADCGGELVGWGGWTPHTSARAWLTSELCYPLPDAETRSLYVDPAWLRRGFGRRLLTAIEDDMAASGYRQASVFATMSSIAFFRRLGYGADAVGEAKLSCEAPLRGLDMRKALEPSPRTGD
jgi:GNAT superfamily N-acetyltransferase